MTKNQKISAAIKAELKVLQADKVILAAQIEVADSQAKREHYARLLTLVSARVALLTGL